MEGFFELTAKVRIQSEINWVAVNLLIERMKRDLDMTLKDTGSEGNTILLRQEEVPVETYHISFPDKETMVVGAADELGFVYALLFISETYLGIQPFWFWNDQKFILQDQVQIPVLEYFSQSPKVRYRGWFINDEVLLDRWRVSGNSLIPWEMALEALLRCGGNMVIPGTDNNSRKYREMATNLGLWITHHHAEPLGAEMFSRRYPDKNPSYDQFPELFQGLWEEGIKEQKGKKVIWNLGFRGQGDCPFWSSDPRYGTDKARGELISSVIKLQYDLVCSKVNNPVCCTNLYGEIMELYRDGFITLPEDIIKIWADNGYGKMVSRRQNNTNPRIYALPQRKGTEQKEEHHGIYYHVSFYDLQAANHLTMQPNSLEFVSKELQHAFCQGADDFLIVNCSNIKPHVYFLDAIKELWNGGKLDAKKQGNDYVENYYFKKDIQTKANNKEKDLIERIYECYSNYSECTVPFGTYEDEHGGEQFYNYTVRTFTSYWLKGEITRSVKELHWATGDISFERQILWFLNLCKEGKEKFSVLHEKCLELHKVLEGQQKTQFEDSVFMQVKIHLNCLEGAVFFCESFGAFLNKSYQTAFFMSGGARDKFQAANDCMRQSEHDKWVGFYENDCLCDIKQTAYLIKFIMGYIRNYGEGPHFYKWQREYLYKEEDLRVVLLTNKENHLTDEELYECMKQKGF